MSSSIEGAQQHTVVQRAFVCKHCGVQCRRPQDLRRHLLAHTDASFSCENCGHKFTRFDTLTRHKRDNCHGPSSQTTRTHLLNMGLNTAHIQDGYQLISPSVEQRDVVMKDAAHHDNKMFGAVPASSANNATIASSETHRRTSNGGLGAGNRHAHNGAVNSVSNGGSPPLSSSHQSSKNRQRSAGRASPHPGRLSNAMFSHFPIPPAVARSSRMEPLAVKSDNSQAGSTADAPGGSLPPVPPTAAASPPRIEMGAAAQGNAVPPSPSEPSPSVQGPSPTYAPRASIPQILAPMAPSSAPAPAPPQSLPQPVLPLSQRNGSLQQLSPLTHSLTPVGVPMVNGMNSFSPALNSAAHAVPAVPQVPQVPQAAQATPAAAQVAQAPEVPQNPQAEHMPPVPQAPSGPQLQAPQMLQGPPSHIPQGPAPPQPLQGVEAQPGAPVAPVAPISAAPISAAPISGAPISAAPPSAAVAPLQVQGLPAPTTQLASSVQPPLPPAPYIPPQSPLLSSSKTTGSDAYALKDRRGSKPDFWSNKPMEPKPIGLPPLFQPLRSLRLHSDADLHLVNRHRLDGKLSSHLSELETAVQKINTIVGSLDSRIGFIESRLTDLEGRIPPQAHPL